jgi:micrococcal nuclease
MPTTSNLETTITNVTSPSPTNPASCIPAGRSRVNAQVNYVFDGDTIEVDINGIEYHVRYIGIDAPEDTRTIEYFGAEATKKNRQLVNDRTVTLVKDISETDKYDRLLRYVLIENIFVNYQMVVDGYAFAGTYPPDIACDRTFMQAERYARDNHLGLWETQEKKSTP